MTLESSPDPWIRALRHSHEVLRTAVEPLDAEQLRQPSYASEWSIAQVLSHLGSQAEIFSLFIDAGLTGQEPPGRDDFLPIWDSWNNRDPQAQAADGLHADRITLERFESLSDEDRARLRLSAFGNDLDVTELARMRLSEHALHTWDVTVALDPAVTLAPDVAALLLDSLADLAARVGKADGKERKLRVTTSDPDRRFILETGENITLTPGADGDPGLPELRLPTEALVRMVCGRLDPQGDPVLDDVRQVFPGY
jgi:uncharacterized protein (TIGR03083 family)